MRGYISYRSVALYTILICIMLSCEQDRYEAPISTPKTYSFTIPGKISFDFSQQSMNSATIIPYTNSANLRNLGNDPISGDYIILSFTEDTLDYTHLGFIEQGTFENIQTNDTLSGILLQPSDILFSDDNLIAAIVNFNDPTSDHPLNGHYTGEFNIYTPADNSNPETFVKTINAMGFVDYLGRFNFFNIDNTEDAIVRLTGDLNASNLISGNIWQRDTTVLSVLGNIEGSALMLSSEDVLTGDLGFTENNQEFILRFNLNQHH